LNKEVFHIISFTSDRLTMPLHPVNMGKAGCKVTVVIGPNGAGKSTIVGKLVDELDWMHALIHPNNHRRSAPRIDTHSNSKIEYRFGETIYRLERKGLEVNAFVGDRRVDLKSIKFPSRALAVAHLPADKFRFSRNEDQGFYWYLGLRQATNLATTGALEAKVISSLLSGLTLEQYRRALSEWLHILQIGVDFELELRNLRPDSLEIKSLDDLERIGKYPQSRGALRYLQQSSSLKFDSNTEPAIVNFFSRLRSLSNSYMQSTSQIKRSYRPSISIPFKALKDDVPNGQTLSWDAGIELIRKLRLADEVRLIVSKNGKRTAFADLSSGERQIFGTVTRLFEYAQDRCVIAIDEPEVSLHPSWQIRYIPTLLKALSHLRSCHVIIATHSHFMVSDVDEEASLIVPKQSDDGEMSFQPFEGEVHGRSPENILYRVFGVGTGSNFYVEQDLAKALKMIAGTSSLNEVELRQIRGRLERVSAEDNPAFNQILYEIDKHLPETL
jgi:ABC-type cobalamin/Fe3+-siderophores transport system ATPase subunit